MSHRKNSEKDTYVYIRYEYNPSSNDHDFSHLNCPLALCEPSECKFSLFIVTGAGKQNLLQWDLVCKSSSSVSQSKLWVEPLVHRPQKYLQAPCAAAKASFCSRTLSRDPLTAFRSDIVLLSSAHILSSSSQTDLAMHWPPSQQICKWGRRGRGLGRHHQTAGRFSLRNSVGIQEALMIKPSLPKAAKCKANEWMS